MDPEKLCLDVLSDDACGAIGCGLWRSSLQAICSPPWGPRWDYASLCGAKSPKGFRTLWVLGGDTGTPMNDIWRSNDGGICWTKVAGGPRWGARSRLAVCGGATTPSEAGHDRPIGIIYVIGGQSRAGFYDDVWASDTAGRTWHCMNNRAPFGPRADMACIVVPPNPMSLLVGGGISSDLHRDLWLSRDAGETFSQLEVSGLPMGFSLSQWPPHILCAAQCQDRLVLWSLQVSTTDVCLTAELHLLGEDLTDAQCNNFVNQVPRPPKISIDLESQVALAWDRSLACMIAYPLGGAECAKPIPLHDMQIQGRDVHIHCDMDGRFENLRQGRVWLISTTASTEIFRSGRTRLAAQKEFVNLIGLHLNAYVPRELWLDRICSFIFPAKKHCLSKLTCGFGFDSLWKVVHKPRVAVRFAPSATSEIVAVAPYGTEVRPVESIGDWLRIEGDLRGWILRDGHSLGLGKLLERVL